MIFCVSRTYAKAKEIQHQKSSSFSVVNSAPPETNQKSVNDLYVSNNMMLSILTVSGHESLNNQSQITLDTTNDDNQFYSYRKQLQKQLSERKVQRNYDLEQKTSENNSRQSIQLLAQVEPQQNQRQSRRVQSNLVKIPQTSIQTQQQNNPSVFRTSSNNISYRQHKFQNNDIDGTTSIICDDDGMKNTVMNFQPFQFKELK